MERHKQKIRLGIFAVGIVLLGFLREYIFKNINWIFLTLTNGRMNAARHEFYFLLDWTPSEINLLKWVLTGAFSLAFFAITYFTIRIAFNKANYSRLTIYVYFVLLVVPLILYLFAELTDTTPVLYGVIRNIMGIVQSFKPLMILFILFKFLPQSKEN